MDELHLVGLKNQLVQSFDKSLEGDYIASQYDAQIGFQFYVLLHLLPSEGTLPSPGPGEARPRVVYKAIWRSRNEMNDKKPDWYNRLNKNEKRIVDIFIETGWWFFIARPLFESRLCKTG